MDLSDSPASGVRLMDSADASSRSKRDRRQGSPSLPNLAFPARCPLRPRRAPSLLVNISSRRISGFGISDRLATLDLRNEANSGLLALRLAGSFHGASTRRLLDALSASLHAGYSVGMMNTFQFIGLVGGAGAPEIAKTQRTESVAGESLQRREFCRFGGLTFSNTRWTYRPSPLDFLGLLIRHAQVFDGRLVELHLVSFVGGFCRFARHGHLPPLVFRVFGFRAAFACP